ncbi:MAG: hypothetical protein ACR2HF_00185 [Methylococcaceae bacterium]
MSSKIQLRSILLPLILIGSVVTSYESSAEAKKEDAAMLQTLRKAQGMLRDVSQQKADLETQLGKVQDQLKAAETRVRELSPLENEVRESKASLDQLRNQNDGLQQRVSEGNDRYRGLAEKERSTETELNRFKADNQMLVSAVKERMQWIDSCTRKNADMLTANHELAGKYQNKGFWAKVKEIEPFVQTGRVASENESQTYHFRLEDLKVTPWQDEAAVNPINMESPVNP